jgi:hypothetical protein
MDPEARLHLISLLAQDLGHRCRSRHPAQVFDGSSEDAGSEYAVALRNALERIKAK